MASGYVGGARLSIRKSDRKKTSKSTHDYSKMGGDGPVIFVVACYWRCFMFGSRLVKAFFLSLTANDYCGEGVTVWIAHLPVCLVIDRDDNRTTP